MRVASWGGGEEDGRGRDRGGGGGDLCAASDFNKNAPKL